MFLPGESQGRGSLVGCRLWGRTESDPTEATQQQQQQQQNIDAGSLITVRVPRTWGCHDCSVAKESTYSAGDTGNVSLTPGSVRSPGGGKWQPIPVFLPEKSHGRRSLEGRSRWGR